MGICCSGFPVLSIALVISGDSRSHSWLQVIQVISRVKEEEKKKKHTKGSRRNAAAAASAVAAATAAVAVADVVAAACFWGGGGRDRAAAVAASASASAVAAAATVAIVNQALLQLRTIKYIVDSRGFWSCYLLSIVSVVGYSNK